MSDHQKIESSHVDYGNQTSNVMEKMYYKLDEIKSKNALEKIECLTNNFDDTCKMTPEFISNLRKKLDNENVIFEGFLYAPTDSNITRQVIGRNGCYFHQTTEKQSIEMIWHDTTVARPVFRFWGQKANVIKAMNIIRHRIHIKTKNN